ncbi:MAG: helix-turn-helix transcriptional regulator [Alphaproteobacteria bacterium]
MTTLLDITAPSRDTKRSIIDLLKWHGPSAAAWLADQLDITPMAARQHLYALEKNRLVEARAQALGVGRPAKFWQLTPAAEKFFPQGYAELTTGLLSAVRAAFGEAGIEKIVAVRTTAQIDTYRARLSGTPDLKERLKRLVTIRNEEGYMAQVEPCEAGYLLTENHCPICAAATACQALCAAELHLFTSVLGANVTIKRTDHILAGARRCAYLVCESQL